MKVYDHNLFSIGFWKFSAQVIERHVQKLLL